MKNPHPPALRKAIKDYKALSKDQTKINLYYERQQEMLRKKFQALEEQGVKLATMQKEVTNVRKRTLDSATIRIMNEANAAGLNAAQIIISLHATNTTAKQPCA